MEDEDPMAAKKTKKSTGRKGTGSGRKTASSSSRARKPSTRRKQAEDSYADLAKDSELTLKWNNCAKTIKDYSWRAIYAKSDAEFNHHVGEMKKLCANYGYEDCVAWCEQEAAQMWELSQKK